MRREVFCLVFFFLLQFSQAPKASVSQPLSLLPEPTLLVALVPLQGGFVLIKGPIERAKGMQAQALDIQQFVSWQHVCGNKDLDTNKVGKLQLSMISLSENGIAQKNGKWKRENTLQFVELLWWTLPCQRCLTHLKHLFLMHKSESFIRTVFLLAFWLFIPSFRCSSQHPCAKLKWTQCL